MSTYKVCFDTTLLFHVKFHRRKWQTALGIRIQVERRSTYIPVWTDDSIVCLTRVIHSTTPKLHHVTRYTKININPVTPAIAIPQKATSDIVNIVRFPVHHIHNIDPSLKWQFSKIFMKKSVCKNLFSIKPASWWYYYDTYVTMDVLISAISRPPLPSSYSFYLHAHFVTRRRLAVITITNVLDLEQI